MSQEAIIRCNSCGFRGRHEFGNDQWGFDGYYCPECLEEENIIVTQ